MKNFVPNGIITALITPFKNDKINYTLLEKIITKQLQANINGILLFGTTGEPLSLSENEKKEIYFTTNEIVKNKVPIITGICDVYTKNAIQNSIKYKNWGSNAILQITPYYYKCNENGIYKHFSLVAKECKLPIIIYNVPARTAFDLTANKELLKKISSIDNIVAIKLTDKNIKNVKRIVKDYNLTVLCGCDEMNFEYLKSGAKGIISVVSNAYPVTLNDIYQNYVNGKIHTSRVLNKTLKKFYKLCSCEPNPIPIKFALETLYDEEINLRLPLDIISLKNTYRIRDFINNYKELK